MGSVEKRGEINKIKEQKKAMEIIVIKLCKIMCAFLYDWYCITKLQYRYI